MPPRGAHRLLQWLLPAPECTLVRSDLDEEFRQEVLPARGPHRARLWYWRQVLEAVPYAVRLRCLPVIVQIPSDVRYALRIWRAHPAFSSVAIITQAVGIGVATSVFAVVYAVLLRPLPYADPHRLVQIFEGTTGSGLLSYPDFLELSHTNRSFEAVAGFNGGSVTLAVPGGVPERVASATVTSRFFDVLGVQPFAGRAFTDGDAHRGAPNVVILTHAEWQRRFAGDPGAVGRTLTLNGQPHTVVGILPAEYRFPLRGQATLWLPERPSPLQEERGYWHWMDVIGRRRSGVSDTQLESDLQAVAAAFARRDPKFHDDARLRVRPLHDVIVGRIRPALQAILAGVALVLLATCATLAGMLLARGAGRSRELSVRSALGANRSRLVQQLLTESMLLSLAGGIAGLVLGYWLLRGFVATLPPAQLASLPQVDAMTVAPRAGLAALALSGVTGVLLGVFPALRASRGFAHDWLRRTRTTADRAQNRLRFVFVGLQVAVATILVAGALLLGASVYRLLQTSPGFDPEGVVTLRLSLPERYRDTANEFMDLLLERIEGIGGVLGAAAINQAPLTGVGNTATLPAVDPPVDVALRRVTANYFSVLGIPLERGRSFAREDSPSGRKVVLVNRRLAERLAAKGDPVGQRLSFEFSPGPWHVIGIVGNERFDHLDRPILPTVYFVSTQDPLGAFTLVVRSTQPAAVPPAVRSLVAALDPELPVFDVRTIEQIAGNSPAVFVRRAVVWVLAVFAVTAVLLAVLALYSVLAQAVAERTREIGIRRALGAPRAAVFRLVLRSALLATVAGLSVGTLVTVVAARVLSSLLFEISPREPLAIAASTAFIGLVAIGACALPALRATRIAPAEAIRAE